METKENLPTAAHSKLVENGSLEGDILSPKDIAIKLLQLGEKKSDNPAQLVLVMETRDSAEPGWKEADIEGFFQKHRLPPFDEFRHLQKAGGFRISEKKTDATLYLDLQALERTAGMSWETAHKRLPQAIASGTTILIEGENIRSR